MFNLYCTWVHDHAEPQPQLPRKKNVPQASRASLIKFGRFGRFGRLGGGWAVDWQMRWPQGCAVRVNFVAMAISVGGACWLA